ncbi:hypothetical protein N9E91_02485, partial [Alphaproteobacteria bacterium]|nr:hypothetical protein [Alphaproteobacteria bacterium]
ELFRGTLYPQPGSHKFSLVSGMSGDDIKTDLELEWAAPILKYIMRPDLQGVSVVKACNNKYALEMTTIMYKRMNERRAKKGLSLL